MRRDKAIRILFVFGFLMTAGLAVADYDFELGGRLGVTSNPDQVVIGGAAAFDNVITEHLRIEPSLLAGFGDDYSTIRISGQGKYRFKIEDQPFELYPIFGLSAWYWKWDRRNFDLSYKDNGVEFGLDIGGGVLYQDFEFDVTLGVGDIPDFLVTISYMIPL